MRDIRLAHISTSPEKAARGLSASGGKIIWVFLGQDYLMLMRWEKALGALGPDFERMDISRLLDEVSDEIRHPFVGWVDGQSRRFGKDADWWFTQLANRNPVESSFFLYTCYLHLIGKLRASGMPALVVAESWGLMEALKRLYARMGLGSAMAEGWKARLMGLSGPLMLSAYWGWFLLNSLKRSVAARGTGKKTVPESGPSSVLVDTYVYPGQLSGGNKFSDRHFPHLHEWLVGNGFDITVLPTLYGVKDLRGLISAYRWLRRSTTRFLIPEDWLKVGDYFAVLKGSLKAVFKARKIEAFRDIGIGPILREESFRPKRIEAKLHYLVPFRLSGAGYKPSVVINWFENQDIDKALTLGSRGAFRNSKVIGAQPYNPFPNFLSLFPTRAEADFGVVPDFIVSCGTHQQGVFPGYFDSGVPYRVGAGLRFDYLWHIVREQDDGRLVLVTLPARLSEAVELVSVISAIVKRAGVRWHVKPHPDYEISAVRDAVGNGWPAGLEPWEGSMAEALKVCSVLISAGSGSALEAAALGIPVIIIGRQTALNFNPLVWFKAYWKLCYTARELEETLSLYLNLSGEEKREAAALGSEIRSRCFTPVNGDTLRAYVGG